MNTKKLNGRACIRVLIILSCLTFYVTKSATLSTILSAIVVALMLLEIYKVPKYSVTVLLFFSFEAMGLLPSVKLGSSTLSWGGFEYYCCTMAFCRHGKGSYKKR